jgi:hypothetical protein
MDIPTKLAALRAEGRPFPAELRPYQSDAIDLVLRGSSVVLNIPTGGGKTLPQVAVNLFAPGEAFPYPSLTCISFHFFFYVSTP